MSVQEPFPPSQVVESPSESNEEISTIQLIEREVRPRGKNVLGYLWYRLAAPKEPDASASLKQREAYRRGQMVSVVLLFLTLILFTVWLTVGIFVNSTLFPILAGLLLVVLGAILLNRGGYILLAGIIVVLVDDLAVTLDLLTSSGGIGVYHLPLLDIFIQGEILAVALLPAEWVFAVAAVHIAFIVSVFTWLPVPRTKELEMLIHSPTLIDLIARPVVVQVFVAVGTYVWAKSAGRALQRADRAATIATFEHSLSEQALEEVEQRKSLDQSMQIILDALSQFAKSKRPVRISQEQLDRQFWDIANSLNEQFVRVQHLSQVEIQLERTHKAAQHFLTEVQRASSQPIFWQATGTIIDAVAKDYNARLSNKQTR